MIEFKMPSLGADMEDGTLVEWFKQPGDTLHRGDIIALVETQKGAIEIEVFEEGTLGQHKVELGQKVPVGTVIATIIAPGETRAEAPLPLTAAPAPEPPGAEAARPEPVKPVPKPVVPQPAEPAAEGLETAELLPPAVRATPAARRRAAELGIALEFLGPGPDGVIGLEQIVAAKAEGRAPEKPQPAVRAGLDLGEMRKAIAAVMSRSHHDVPHYWVSHSIDVTVLLRWIEAENDHRPVTRRLLYVAPLMKAIAITLKEVPELNGHFDGTFRATESVHMGIATALRGGGLVAPAIRDVDRLDVGGLMVAIADLVPRGRAGRLRSSEMTDGTVTLSNLGEGSAETVLPLIYPPQVAIIGCGAATLRPWAVGDAVAVRQVMNVTVAGDHRVSDGRRAAQFLIRLAQLLEHPEDL
jgi:pyruvate dehydrogenase E2 component (dihydrolipoamide acetyltransferase)